MKTKILPHWKHIFPKKFKSCPRASLKQRSRTHLVPRQSSSQLQKYKAAQMSRRHSIQSEGMQRRWRTHKVDNLKLVNYTRIENAHKVCKQICFLLCGCYMYYY